MNWSLPFGFVIRKKDESQAVSFTVPENEDGALEKQSSGPGFSSYNFGTEFTPKSEIELINKYRSIQLLPELDSAIEDVVSEAIVVEDVDDDCVNLNINADDTELPKEIKKIITDEFKNIISLMEFKDRGHELFRQWYVDGRIYYHIIVDESDLTQGIKEVRLIDPRKIKKVREIQKRRQGAGLDIITSIEEYFVFNDSGISENMGIKLSPDTIVYTPSGLTDEAGNVISYIHKAIKPANMLRLMEDAMLIYQMTRAPERRVFYIDVSGMPKAKAEQYLKDAMNRYRNKVAYNSATGEIKDDRQHMSMLEDFWMPRTSNGRATEITTLASAQIQGQIDAVAYYLNKMLGALNVPASRVKGDTPFNLGRSMEITRDEIKFAKFIARLRRKFSDTFLQLLRVQLILKGVIAPEDWTFIKSKLQFDFVEDNHFAELRDNEILAQRIQMFEQIQPLIGKFFSEDYARRKIMRQSEEEMEEEDKKIEIEREEQFAMMKKHPELFQQDEEGNPIHPSAAQRGQ